MVHVYNCTRSDATRFSPYYLMFGHATHLLVDVAFGLFPQPFNAAPTSQYVQELQCHLKSAHDLISKTHHSQQLRNQHCYNHQVLTSSLDIGDFVLLRNMYY